MHRQLGENVFVDHRTHIDVAGSSILLGFVLFKFIGHKSNGFDPFFPKKYMKYKYLHRIVSLIERLPFFFAFDVEAPFDDGRPLQPPDRERVRFRTIERHNLATLHREVVQGFVVVEFVGLTLVSDEVAVVEQYEIAHPPRFDVLSAFVQPSFLDDLGARTDG